MHRYRHLHAYIYAFNPCTAQFVLYNLMRDPLGTCAPPSSVSVARASIKQPSSNKMQEP